MNYRNHSMLELVTILGDADDTYTFIEASKVFIQKFVDGNYVPKDEIDNMKEAEYQEGYDKGYEQAHQDAADEAGLN